MSVEVALGRDSSEFVVRHGDLPLLEFARLGVLMGLSFSSHCAPPLSLRSLLCKPTAS